MPKGMEQRNALRVHCDFCGGLFNTPRWNCRTCPQCAAEGRPDQSLMAWGPYLRAAKAVSFERRPERKAAADRANFAQGFITRAPRPAGHGNALKAKTPL